MAASNAANVVVLVIGGLLLRYSPAKRSAIRGDHHLHFDDNLTAERPTFVTHLECAYTGERHAADAVHNLSRAGKPLLVRYDLVGIAKALSKEALARRAPDLWRYRELLPVRRVDDIVSLGAALAAYATRTGIRTTIFCPEDTPEVNVSEIALQGATVYRVNGLIDDCGKIVGAGKEEVGWFDVSTLKEPYRIEGKKTMGLELAEQLGWELPDVILYPTGGGTGL